MQPTNATKAIVIALVNAIFSLLAAFGISFTAAQTGAVLTIVNLLFLLYVSFTYEDSPNRVNGS